MGKRNIAIIATSTARRRHLVEEVLFEMSKNYAFTGVFTRDQFFVSTKYTISHSISNLATTLNQCLLTRTPTLIVIDSMDFFDDDLTTPLVLSLLRDWTFNVNFVITAMEIDIPLIVDAIDTWIFGESDIMCLALHMSRNTANVIRRNPYTLYEDKTIHAFDDTETLRAHLFPTTAQKRLCSCTIS